ncbi:MAG: choline-sulfatase [Pseudomonadota bacterium]
MPPNIVLIMADQLAPQFMATYGGAAITPHMDALAARGTRFDRAYCNSPLCVPSRASFMTGQHVTDIAAWDNAAEFPASIPTFAHYLGALGYRTCLSGKMHFVGPDQKHGFTDRVTTDYYPSDFAWTPDWTRNDDRIDIWYHNMRTVTEAGSAVATDQADFDEEADFAARRWLMERARDKAAGQGQPFCLVLSLFHPHDPYIALQPFWDLYEDVDIPMPETEMPPDRLDPFSRRVADGVEASTDTLSPEDTRAARRAYLANVSYFDSKVGALMAQIEAMGETENTVFIVTSDHGDMLGERGMWFKMSFLEHSARVPLIMAGPGVAQGARDTLCSLIDLLPTLTDIAGGDESLYAQPIAGRSLLPAARGEAQEGEVIGQYCAECAGAPVFMIRRDDDQGDLKYIHCDLDPPVFYDLAADPHELTNLAEDPAYAEAARAFAREVRERWDSAAISAQVIRSQQTRLKLNAMMDTTGDNAWDYSPPRDASNEYVRNHRDWVMSAARARFPPFER